MSSGNYQMDTTTSKARKHVTTACMPCRTAKTKCNGQSPCEECVRRDRKCDYGQEQDIRMLGKRAYAELNSRSEILEALLVKLKNNDARANEELLEIIRGGATTVEIAQHALDATGRSGSSAKKTRSNVMDILSLTDQPLYRVPAQPWTDVTDDDDAVSHLLSIYLTWQQCCYPAFDPEILVREVRSQQLSSRYCSKFLVNAILTLACMYTDHSVAFAERGNSATRGAHFFEETMKLWQLEEGRPTLANLQGLTILVVCMVFMGKDRLALLHGSQLQTLRNDMLLKIRAARKANSMEYSDPEFQRSWRYAAWSSFKIEVEMSMAWRTSFNITKPTVERPYPKNELQFNGQWRPYPKTEPEIAYNPRLIDEASISLYVIGADICSIILSGNPQDSPLPGYIILEPSERLAKAHDIERDLLAWQDDIFPILTPQILSGPVMNLQLTYNIWRLELNNIILNEDTAPDSDKENARERIIAACKRTATLLQHGHNNFGLMNFPSHTMHAATVCANHLINYITEPQIPDVLHTMILTLTAVCYRWVLARGITKGLWITIQQQNIEQYLLDETVSLFKLNAVENWSSKDHQLFVSCAYPNYAMSSARSRDVVSIGDMLQTYAKLDINETNETKSKE